MPTIGFSKSPSPKPTARSMARLGERTALAVMARLRELRGIVLLLESRLEVVVARRVPAPRLRSGRPGLWRPVARLPLQVPLERGRDRRQHPAPRIDDVPLRFDREATDRQNGNAARRWFRGSAWRDSTATPRLPVTASLTASLLPSSSRRSGRNFWRRKCALTAIGVPEPGSRRMKRCPERLARPIRRRRASGCDTAVHHHPCRLTSPPTRGNRIVPVCF